jgi:hypothetical protein
MAKILNQDQLMQERSLVDYGLKVEGLVKLKRFLQDFDLSTLDIRYPVTVPPFFAVPVGSSLENGDLSNAYSWLTNRFHDPRIILARSSDPNEMPGKFETYTSLFDPANPDQSFQNWLKAANRVRASGARALIGQPLAAKLEDFRHDIDYDYDNDYKQVDISSTSFGGSNSSFFGRSHSVIRGPHPFFVICGGLASKIARGDNDVSIAQNGKWRMDIIQLNHNYTFQSFAKCNQESVDVVTLENPDQITTLKYHKDAQFFDYVLENAQLPFSGYLFRDDANEYYGFNMHHLFVLIHKLSKQIGKPVEIEGCVNEEGLYLFQLREYEILQKRLESLTDVPEDKQVRKFNERESIGCDQLRGDLILSEDILDYEEGTIFGYLGNIRKAELPDLRKYRQFVFPMARVGGLYEAAHSFGYTAQVLVELEKMGTRAIAIGGLEGLSWNLKDSDRVTKVNDRTTRIRDVTVECDGVEAQIYFN